MAAPANDGLKGSVSTGCAFWAAAVWEHMHTASAAHQPSPLSPGSFLAGARATAHDPSAHRSPGEQYAAPWSQHIAY